MGTLKSFAALLLSVAALLTSVLALNAAQKKAEMQKAAAQTVTKAVVAAQEETALASALDSDTCEAKLLGSRDTGRNCQHCGSVGGNRGKA